MAELRHGSISLKLPDELLPESSEEGQGPMEVSRIPKTPRSLGWLCEQAAQSLEKAGEQFIPQPPVSPESLRQAGFRTGAIDRVVHDVEAVLSVLYQMRLMYQVGAYEHVRELYDQIVDQGTHRQELRVLFRPVLEFFSRIRGEHKDCPILSPDPVPAKTPFDKNAS